MSKLLSSPLIMGQGIILAARCILMLMQGSLNVYSRVLELREKIFSKVRSIEGPLI